MILRVATAVVAVAGLACVPLMFEAYGLSLAINLISYTVLATAWSLFSGPTRYVSLATVAFFGIGAYTTAVFAETLAWPLVLLIATGISLVVAAVVGLSTLRLSGVYFVIFTLGLAELVRQLVTWFEVNKTRTLGRYVFTDITASQIYWQLLALAVLVFAAGFLIGRSRLGLALRVVGDDETVARHVGIDTTRAKVALFVLSTVFMTLTGAIMAPRWTYIDPAIAFNPVVSFTVLIMALLGGVHRLYGPVLGVVPLALLFEFLLARFPNHFSLMVGVVFIVIVYAIPRGIAGLLESGWEAGMNAALLQVKGLTRRFGGLVAVDGMSFTLEAGEIVGLLGPNGSGKTTVLNLLSGALRCDTGRVVLRGEPIDRLAAHKIARRGIARTFQLVRPLASLDCRDNVLAGLAFGTRRLWGAAARREADLLLDRVGLGGTAGKLPGALTYIDQKRLELARALAIQPTVLLLDEWLAGLNATELDQGIELIRSLRGEGIAILLVEHVMDAIRSLCDRVLMMNAGRLIASGLPQAVLADPEVVRAYLGDDDV